MAKGIIITIAVVVVLAVAVFFIFSFQGEDTGVLQGGQASQNQSSSEEQMEEEIPAETQPSVLEFVIEADDDGFYVDGADINSIFVNSGGMLKITFNVRSQNVYYNGLDFRGCGQDTENVRPGGSTMVEFTAASTCTITSYWPSSGVVKDNLMVDVT